jgi:type I restriction enzyme, R subunit
MPAAGPIGGCLTVTHRVDIRLRSRCAAAAGLTAISRAKNGSKQMPETPEQTARRQIDADLAAAGWIVQDREDLDLTAGRGIAVREFRMKSGLGFADYLLYLDRKAAAAVEAKPEGTLTGVEAQSAKYAAGLPDNLPAHRRPLPFLFESNGRVTFFTNGLDPVPRSRQVFNFPRPETMADWLVHSCRLPSDHH